ncbi:MAG TPA: glycosyltransferase family 39 protein [Terriglobales bacterium]|nr:glycosyltransferase family 39 protein [Terriglobales bacterium]
MTSSRAAGSSPPAISNPQGRKLSWPGNALPVIVLAGGLIARLIPASRLFLNPDEALHNLLASQSSLAGAWAAALTNAHPPLLIVVLYYWRALGHSELWLRMPSVLAGTAACWLFYLWLKLAMDRTTAFFGLLLFSFAPSLILLSAEVRQYALLLSFMAGCLYLSERAIQEDSIGTMILFSLSLYGALLTHYSALIFALAMGVYMLARLYPYRSRLGLFAAWGLGQMGGIAIAVYFLLTHIPQLRQSGMVRADLESYLSKSIFHPGQRNPAEFVVTQTLRVFTYTFSHGLVGTLGLLAFLAGMAWLLRRASWNRAEPSDKTAEVAAKRPRPRQLALLLGLPFVVSWGVALAGLYPLGATRHDAFLAPFALAGVCVGIAQSTPAKDWTKALIIVLCLAVCNLFPAPPPPIRARDQSAALMKNAVTYLRESARPGSVFFTDYESGLLLGYYLCGHGVVQIFPSPQPLAGADCGAYRVLATSFHDWKFTAATFPAEFTSASKMLSPGAEVWLFYAGWINDSAPAMKPQLAQYGCPAPKNFGENILICRLTAGESDGARRRGQ